MITISYSAPLAGALLLIVTAPTQAQVVKMSNADVEWYATGIAYRQCATKQAVKLEPSGELPRDIATASLAACRGIRADLLDQIQTRVQHDHSNLSVIDQSRVSARAIELTDKERRADAVLAVVQERAKRKKIDAPNR